jgi:hypothetical protein
VGGVAPSSRCAGGPWAPMVCADAPAQGRSSEQAAAPRPAARSPAARDRGSAGRGCPPRQRGGLRPGARRHQVVLAGGAQLPASLLPPASAPRVGGRPRLREGGGEARRKVAFLARRTTKRGPPPPGAGPRRSRRQAPASRAAAAAPGSSRWADSRPTHDQRAPQRPQAVDCLWHQGPPWRSAPAVQAPVLYQRAPPAASVSEI